MRTVHAIDELRRLVRAERADGRRIGFFATLGGLHDGHLAGVRLARQHADVVVVSVFLNPTQFERPDDLARYPRDLDADVRLLASLGPDAPDVVFAPSVDALYPRPLLTSVRVDDLGDRLEGAARPGHLSAVATVVTKLLNIVTPDVTVFGRKDLQQLQVVRRLVDDLDLDVEVVAAPTARDHDGLAASSRNQQLGADARARAVAVPLALARAVEVAREHRRSGDAVAPEALVAAGLSVLQGAEVDVDYLEVVEPDTLLPCTTPLGPGSRAALVAAVLVDGVRLLDNVELGDRADELRLLAAVGLDDLVTDPADGED